MRISDWSSDVCSSDLCRRPPRRADRRRGAGAHRIAGGGMTRVFVSRDMASVALGADALARALSDMGCEVVRTGSRGLFSIEPLVEVETEDGRIGYGQVQPEDVAAVLNGTHPNRLGRVEELPFFAGQQRFTFARCGVIDPLSMADYAAHDGWKGLKAARAQSPQQVVDAVQRSEEPTSELQSLMRISYPVLGLTK